MPRRSYLRDAFSKARNVKHFAALFCVYLALVVAGVAASGEVVVASYNLENYLLMERRGSGKSILSPKPEKEIQALIRIIKEINPDILGVCEMGSKEEFEDFKSRLKQEGLGYTDFEYVEGADQERHLALASRFKIVSRQSMPNVPFTANGIQEKVRRGFLDVTVKINAGCQLRLVGAHLKSKLAAPEGNPSCPIIRTRTCWFTAISTTRKMSRRFRKLWDRARTRTICSTCGCRTMSATTGRITGNLPIFTSGSILYL